MMLLSVVVINLFIKFHFGLTAVADTTGSRMDVPYNEMEQLNSFSSKAVIKQFQKSLQEIQETQSILVGKVNTLFNSEWKYSASIQEKKRVRRGVEEDPLTTLPHPNVLATSGENCGDTRDSGNNSPRTTSGTVYVRWGHTECPSHSTLIYSGTAAGPNHNAAGNGANQLCLPENPFYDNPVAGVGTSRAFLYSLEYQIDSFPALQSHTWKDVSCAVCKSPSRFAQLMIPGKQTCPSGEWTLEYSGYLMTERSHPNHKRSMYICVDRELQSKPRTHGHNGDRAALNLVEGRCISSGGGLPCGPYVDGYEITCAVCTQ